MGRPQKDGNVFRSDEKCHVTISMYEDVRRQAMEYAYKNGKTLSQLIDELLRREINSNSNKPTVTYRT
jgi:hypothetical protein